MASREQAISLLSAANNHGDLAVKLSSLKQAKDILLSVEPPLAAELFPYLIELQFSPEPLVRKMLLEIIEAIGPKALEYSRVLVPIVVSFLRDADRKIVRHSIVVGAHFFCAILEEMAVQFHRCGKLEWWHDELWKWMVRFKDSVFTISLEPGSVGTKLLALKFLETCVLLFTAEPSDSEKLDGEGSRQVFNVSWLVSGHPLLDPVVLMADANRTLGILLNFLRLPGSLPGSLTIAVVNCLAAIARKRPVHYSTILSALLDFDPSLQSVKECHSASVHCSLRTAFLGFLRCTCPAILETREKLLTALRAMNAGDAAEQVIRQVDKMIRNNERASREVRFARDDQQVSQMASSGDQFIKRHVPMDEELDNGHEVTPKRMRYGSNTSVMKPIKSTDYEQDSVRVNGLSTNVSVLDSDLTPAEKMIAMIGALLAEGERGAESLELLISTIHPDLLADIVVVNMKHLPKLPPILTRPENLSGSVSSQAQVTQADSMLPVPAAQVHYPSTAATISSLSDTSTASIPPADSKRDPRRDPRRLDPRRVASTSEAVMDEAGSTRLDSDGPESLSKPTQFSVAMHNDSVSAPLSMGGKTDNKGVEETVVSKSDQARLSEEVLIRTEDNLPSSDVNSSLEHRSSKLPTVEEESVVLTLPDSKVDYGSDMPSVEESDENAQYPSISSASTTEETCLDLPALPLYVEMSGEQQKTIGKIAIERIMESSKELQWTQYSHIRRVLLSRLIALSDADDDVIKMLQKHIVVDYSQHKGHELVLHVLYYLYSLMVRESVDNSSGAATAYEKFLLAVANSLLDAFPASDKSFSKLLGEVPLLPDSALKLLEDLCGSDVFDFQGKEAYDSERVTQGLGAVWGLIVGRPNNRQTCLDIALKCAVHPQDEIRAKAIRLVTNKLYQLSYISEHIEQFATNKLLSAVGQHTSDVEFLQSGSVDQREGEVVNQVASVSGSQVPEARDHETDSTTSAQPMVPSTSSMSFPEAQRHISLFFALCTKRPNLLQLIFDVYGQAPKTVKLVIHRHLPIVIRSLGSSYSDLLRIMSDAPEGCDNLLMLVLQILTQESTPSTDLITTVKHLYETKLKDAMVLIPILSSLSKEEVLPIFPRLVSLPIEKFQMALAHILQGSAHTGPALTPAEVLVSIHDISPEKDGLALKKITDACTACFDQRTVFTQQVLAKALNQMVDQTPLPLLFMRTVIQAIDAFPSLVDFVMEILSKLVSRQVWKMPKLWVGFLKCASQTRPHSFPVLLQLPPPQLESALNKHANLRGPLASYANQPSIKASAPRSTLAVLGLANELQVQQSHVSSLHPSTTPPAAQGADLT